MSTFIIPLAGLSSRFFKAGYTIPKFMLPLNDQESMFEWSVLSFQKYYESDFFLFVCRNDFDTPAFIKSQIESLKIRNYEIVTLSHNTLGQADTVFEGIAKSQNRSFIEKSDLYIFNIDSKLLDFKKNAFSDSCDGYLEVFREQGEQWSFVVPGENSSVIKTTEKVRVSDFCSNGLYYFKSCLEYIRIHEYLKNNHILSGGELYIAPMYNYLIQENKSIKFVEVERDKVVICGTPADYLELHDNVESKHA